MCIRDRVSTAEILTELRRQGLRPGVYGPGLDEGTISSAALLGLPELEMCIRDSALGLAPLHALVVCIIGNMLPIPFIIVYIRRIFHWMRRRSPRLNALVDKLEKKAHLKGQKVTKYKYIGLWLFVAIPLPGTGAWTGALIAALLDMPLRKSIPSIFLGVVTAGLIMTFVTGGVVAIFAS